MSRTGNMPIEIPDGIDVTLNEENITVKNKSGEKKFKLSRIAFRELANDGKLPGITKSSW